MPENKTITVIGGGTGNFTLLRGLKIYPININAIVSMTDSGGSSGDLQDEMGVLPPGDLRQCIVALMEEGEAFRRVMNHRYDEDAGKFKGQSFGNLMISTFEREMRGLEAGMDEIHKFLRLSGKVIPVTYEKANLRARLRSGEVRDKEHVIDMVIPDDFIEEVFYDRMPAINDRATKAILDADLVVISPGDPNTSILPSLIMPQIGVALRKTKARVAMVCNLMTKYGHSNGYTVGDFVSRYERVIGEPFIDVVIYNTEQPSAEILARYGREGEQVLFREEDFSGQPQIKLIGRNLISHQLPTISPSDKVKRSLIRHDSSIIASLLFDLL